MSLFAQLAIKALVSGVLIALASEVARRNSGWGGLIASLPLVSTLAMVWLWRDTGGDAARVAEFALASTVYVAGSLPAFVAISLLLRRGVGFAPALLAGVALGYAGYVLAGWAGTRLGVLTA